MEWYFTRPIGIIEYRHKNDNLFELNVWISFFFIISERQQTQTYKLE